MASTSNAKKKMSLQKKHNLIGWAFLIPASLLIFVFCFYPMFQAILLSFKKGMGAAQTWAGIANYSRILKDRTFKQCLFNTVFYFIIQVPVMLILALILAQLLNDATLRFKGLFRTMIFLPCATSLVSYSMIFKHDSYKDRNWCCRLVPECVGSTFCDHYRTCMEMDRIQYGILSGRTSEY